MYLLIWHLKCTKEFLCLTPNQLAVIIHDRIRSYQHQPNRLFIIASISWSVWKTRNDWVFNNKLIKTRKSIAYMALGFMKQWKNLLKTKEQQLMEDAIHKLQEGLRAW